MQIDEDKVEEKKKIKDERIEEILKKMEISKKYEFREFLKTVD
ncbi:hypothetical protein [Salmonella enterica]|nr:hypothetical protein [Salmonella enterica]